MQSEGPNSQLQLKSTTPSRQSRHFQRAMRTLALVLAAAAGALAYDNGVAKKPAMGWNTWVRASFPEAR